MNIKIHSIHFDADVKLENFIESKAKKLLLVNDDIIGADVFLRLVKSQKLDNKVAEIKLNIPGTDIFAKKRAKSFEESTDMAVEALRKQLQKIKDKKRGI
jgi:putative sigma-54 modulation protein